MAKERYKDSPTLKRDEDTGEMTPTAKKAARTNDATEGMPIQESGIPMHARHAMDRHHMHAKHETEHSVHDHGKHGSKEELHARHSKEISDMHKRHQKELMKGSEESKGSGNGQEKIDKTESDEEKE